MKSVLSRIHNKNMKEAVRRAHSRFSYKLSFLPASITGKHHPADERDKGGLEKHINKMLWFLDGVASQLGYDERTMDILYTAAYFHDLGKLKDTRVYLQMEGDRKTSRFKYLVSREVVSGDYHVFESVKLAREFLTEAGVEESDIKVICDIIAKHMGNWRGYLPAPDTELEKIFALADYIVSREDFRIEGGESKWKELRKKIRYLF